MTVIRYDRNDFWGFFREITSAGMVTSRQRFRVIDRLNPANRGPFKVVGATLLSAAGSSQHNPEGTYTTRTPPYQTGPPVPPRAALLVWRALPLWSLSCSHAAFPQALRTPPGLERRRLRLTPTPQCRIWGPRHLGQRWRGWRRLLRNSYQSRNPCRWTTCWQGA